MGLLSIIVQARVPVQIPETSPSLKSNPLLTPWKDSWSLLRQRSDFARFQIGFMLGGIGLMMVMPALVLYAADDLKITHFDMTMSRFVWMGLGFVLATPFWRKNMTYKGIFKQTAAANFLFALATLAWIFATFESWWFFVAFFLYGVAQAGSHLSWHLSGPLFAGSSQSSLFSTVNILTVGLRGLLIPGISMLLCPAIGTFAVLWIGLFFCLAGGIYLMVQKTEEYDENRLSQTDC
jgi:MFS family permease